MVAAELAPYLAPTQFLDSREPSLVAFAKDAIGDAADDRTKAVRLFYAVRDALRYDPYMTGLAVEDFRASRILAEGRGFCVPKAIALAACAAAVFTMAFLNLWIASSLPLTKLLIPSPAMPGMPGTGFCNWALAK